MKWTLFLLLLPFCAAQTGVPPSPVPPGTETGTPAAPPSGTPAAPVPATAAPSESDCSWQAPDGTFFDLNPLKQGSGEDYTKSVAVGSNIEFIYRLNFCKNTINDCQKDPAPATESLKIPAGETCRVLGRLGEAELAPKWSKLALPVTATNPQGIGVAIEMGNGDICDPAARTQRSVVINVECDTSVDAPGIFRDVKKEATCQTVFTYASPHGCPSSPGLLGWTFVFGVLAVATVYFVGGMVYNMKRHGSRGMEALPNREFWAELPSLVMDGLRYSAGIVRDVKEWGQEMSTRRSG
eukprot:PLAT13604.1.p2 GENE.PLAT13604.1~~PLAT13604.1.p2  ORF type:complete len:296 (+),score=60.91 PLAT13604.1:28-915(+)